MLIDAQQTVVPRPFLKWAGGKSKLIQQYIKFFPEEFNTYYEPFLGGGAVFFHLQPNNAVLTDINTELINVYCCVRDRVESLIETLNEHQEKHNKDYYYLIRAEKYETEIKRAARIIYLNKTCFNGLYRENSQGKFNVPMGKYKNPPICQPDLLRSVSAALQFKEIKVRSFEKVLNEAKKGDFVYFDPPYHPISATSNFTGYSRDSFSEKDQIRLRDVFAELAILGVKVMLSNSDCELIRELYNNFNIHQVLAARSINSNASKRGKISELLVTSY